MRLPYNQMVVGLDKLFFTAPPQETDAQVQERAETIEAYLEACGWSLDDLVEHLVHEEDSIRNPIH